jgi:hypothetical protein
MGSASQAHNIKHYLMVFDWLLLSPSFVKKTLSLYEENEQSVFIFQDVIHIFHIC